MISSTEQQQQQQQVEEGRGGGDDVASFQAEGDEENVDETASVASSLPYSSRHSNSGVRVEEARFIYHVRVVVAVYIYLFFFICFIN